MKKNNIALYILTIYLFCWSNEISAATNEYPNWQNDTLFSTYQLDKQIPLVWRPELIESTKKNIYLSFFMPDIVSNGVCIYPANDKDVSDILNKKSKILLCMQYNDSLLIIPRWDIGSTNVRNIAKDEKKFFEYMSNLYKNGEAESWAKRIEKDLTIYTISAKTDTIQFTDSYEVPFILESIIMNKNKVAKFKLGKSSSQICKTIDNKIKINNIASVRHIFFESAVCLTKDEYFEEFFDNTFEYQGYYALYLFFNNSVLTKINLLLPCYNDFRGNMDRFDE